MFKDDPFDPNPKNKERGMLIMGAIVAAIVIGIWCFANAKLKSAFAPPDPNKIMERK